jgi:hypothetical protein
MVDDVTIPKTEVHANGHTNFVVLLSMNGVEWEIRRRYSEVKSTDSLMGAMRTD